MRTILSLCVLLLLSTAVLGAEHRDSIGVGVGWDDTYVNEDAEESNYQYDTTLIIASTYSSGTATPKAVVFVRWNVTPDATRVEDSCRLYWYAIRKANSGSVRTLRLMRGPWDDGLPNWLSIDQAQQFATPGGGNETGSCVENAGDATPPDVVGSAVTGCGYAVMGSTVVSSGNWFYINVKPADSRWLAGTSSTYGLRIALGNTETLTGYDTLKINGEGSHASRVPYVIRYTHDTTLATDLRARRKLYNKGE
jgi:hypothetical protein